MLKAKISFVIPILTVLLTAQMCFSAQMSVGVHPADLSGVQLENVKIDAPSITSFFADLSRIYDIPIGLEVEANENRSTRYYIELKKETLAELLTQFVAQHTQYTWKIDEGVVNIFPK